MCGQKASSRISKSGGTKLLKRIYEVDPLTCPKCWGAMQIISFIEDREVIKTILKHPGPWLVKLRPSLKSHAAPLLNDSECFYP